MVSIRTVFMLNFKAKSNTIQKGLELYTLLLNPPSTLFSPSSDRQNNFIDR